MSNFVFRLTSGLSFTSGASGYAVSPLAGTDVLNVDAVVGQTATHAVLLLPHHARLPGRERHRS